MKKLDRAFIYGGYYTNWDFCQELVNDYREIVKSLPINNGKIRI